MFQDFNTIILAGGAGSRLSSVVSDRPKCLATINGRPFLSHLFDQLARAEVTSVILSTGYKAEQVEDTFGMRYGALQLHYSQEEIPLGTGGAVRRALSLCQYDHVLVINGDSFLDFDWREFFEWFDPATMRLGMVLAWMEDCRRFGQVIVGEEGEVQRFEEKSETSTEGWINAGIYLIDKYTLAEFPAPEAFSLERDFFPAQIGRDFYACGCRDRFIDIGTPESYASAEEFFSRPRGHAT